VCRVSVEVVASSEYCVRRVVLTVVCLSSENEEASSGNESREGSANGHRGDLRHVPKPPPGSVPVRMRHRMDLSPSVLTIDGKFIIIIGMIVAMKTDDERMRVSV
jgi:hypothetical protein